MKPGLRLALIVMSVCVAVTRPRAAGGGDERPAVVPDRLVFGTGIAGVFDGERNAMLSVELRGGAGWAGIHPWVGLGWATDGAIFAGGGALYTLGEFRRWQTTVGFGPGYYERNQGPDLGKHLEFLSFVEVSRRLRRGHRVVLRLAHISNGSLGDRNPGTELLTAGYMIPLRLWHRPDRP
ncbi:MAG TPA: acyloxyacyl hydrolase [Opitutaceae bacterium]